jgi:hypothetical protein
VGKGGSLVQGLFRMKTNATATMNKGVVRGNKDEGDHHDEMTNRMNMDVTIAMK